MAYIGTPPSNAFTSLLKQDFSTSATTGYTLDHAVNNANDIALFINFVRQEPTAGYAASGTSLVLTSATASSDDMYCVYLGQALQTVNPPNNSVNEAQLNYPLTTFSSTGIDDNATSTAITIDSAERVGIGKSSPISGYNLSLGKSTNVSGEFTGITFQESTSNFYGYVRAEDNATSDTSFVIGHTVRGIVFKPANTERMRIDSSGIVRMLMGDYTANPSGSNQGITFRNNGSTARVMELGISATGNSTVVQFYNGNGGVGNIQLNGSATAYNTSSDYRLKENVDYTFDATTRLKQLKPARFNFIADDTKTVDGFIAHEVSSVVPEAISGEKDAVKVWKDNEELPEGVSVGDNKLDADGNTIIDTQGIDQSKLVPLLVKTIQELEARITTLENA